MLFTSQGQVPVSLCHKWDVSTRLPARALCAPWPECLAWKSADLLLRALCLAADHAPLRGKPLPCHCEDKRAGSSGWVDHEDPVVMGTAPAELVPPSQADNFSLISLLKRDQRQDQTVTKGASEHFLLPVQQHAISTLEGLPRQSRVLQRMTDESPVTQIFALKCCQRRKNDMSVRGKESRINGE